MSSSFQGLGTSQTIFAGFVKKRTSTRGRLQYNQRRELGQLSHLRHLGHVGQLGSLGQLGHLGRPRQILLTKY